MGAVIAAGERAMLRCGSSAPEVDLRRAGAADLEAALVSGRQALLDLFDGFERALGRGGLRIALDPVLNLPLWELGHIGWFEEFWLARNPDRRLGTGCSPDVPRGGSVLQGADALYDSSSVPHAERWSLVLPEPDACRAYLARVRETTLTLLRDAAAGDDALYFFRLVLFHEDMHREAWHVTAQHLGIDLGPQLARPAPPLRAIDDGEWQVPGCVRQLGTGAGGFGFDNEMPARDAEIDAFAIDRTAVTWARFLPFIEAGGYATQALWSEPGWAWRRRHERCHPRHVRRAPGGWLERRFGVWAALDPAAAALHLSSCEAEAWCRWAGRRLPSEAEWETAATLCEAAGERFEWGQVWEWTASPFAPCAGFVAHPYRDYSQPWFDGRPVLRGASFATTPHFRHVRYRNFFAADRDDVFAGFRSCRV